MSEGSGEGPIAYLINQYPKVSHSFIRREILALERRGVVVQRFAMRGWDGTLADGEDLSERGKTRYLLQRGAASLLGPTLGIFLRAPVRFLSALRLAWRSGQHADRSLAYHFVYFAEACCLLEWLRQGGVTHLHAHFGTNGAEVAMLVRELGGPPYSFTVHGPEEFDKPVLLGLREKIDRAKFVIAISSFGRSQLFRWASFAAWHKIQVVHCGVEPAFSAEATSEMQAPAATPQLVCVGRLCEQKGQLLLLEAVHRLVSRGVPVEMVLAGDGEMREELEKRIGRLHLERQVRITGWISSGQVREEILAARALVLPSFAEGLPVVLMEAMVLGRAVVSTFVAGIPELVEDGKTGWLVPAGDLNALVAALESCLAATPERLSRMGQLGRARALGRHNVDDSAARLQVLFESALTKPDD
jgi:glycosyltransferase involved in cell wall biosynthesis